MTDGQNTAFVLPGTPGMAKGGSGDVLTGVIASLLCGGKAGGMDCFSAALYGAYICGKAGEKAAAILGEHSMDGHGYARAHCVCDERDDKLIDIKSLTCVAHKYIVYLWATKVR